jgi:hypothetical protein
LRWSREKADRETLVHDQCELNGGELQGFACGVHGRGRLVRVGKTSALALVATVTVREEGTQVLRVTDEGAMQVAWRGAPVQAGEIVPLKSVPGVSCRLKRRSGQR